MVSWPESVGVRNANCVRCVLRMKSDLARAGERFRERFGVAPDFRAGLQLGSVTTGEIGALKKEIVFSGDVLNQTARIQALGSELGIDVLVGDELQRHLPAPEGWTARPVGTHVLRGREQAVEIFAVDGPEDGRPA